MGFSQVIDLNRIGPVRLSDDEVFRVAVVAATGQPAPVLPSGQRWRGGVLDVYRQGVWFNGETPDEETLEARKPPRRVPARATGRFGLDFNVGPTAGGCFLAEPVRTAGDADRLTRVESEDPKRPGELGVSSRGPVLPAFYHGSHDYHYLQTAFVDSDPDRSPADIDAFYRDPLVHEQVPGLTEWTTRLLGRLAADPAHGLSASDLSFVEEQPGLAPALPTKVWERAGRALADYLAHSGEYGYTLDLRRQNSSLDPVMDFLVNVKQGHCERFASALALMLRSQGIPARLVVGYRGAAELDNGAYVVRENQAHAWVEMLAPERQEPEPPPPNGIRPYCPPDWLTLDPTPPGDATPPPYSLWDWWQDGARTGQQLWGGLVVNYNADEQAGLWTTLQSPGLLKGLYRAAWALPALTVLGILAWLGLLWRLRRARRAADAAQPAFRAIRPSACIAGPPRPTATANRPDAARVRRGGATPFAGRAGGRGAGRCAGRGRRSTLPGSLRRRNDGGGECAAIGARLDRLAAVNFSL